jgi:hypothetical protein
MPVEKPDHSQGGAARRQSHAATVEMPSNEKPAGKGAEQTSAADVITKNSRSASVTGENDVGMRGNGECFKPNVPTFKINTEFIAEQQADASIEQLRCLAKDGHPSYSIENGILYKTAPTWLNTQVDKVVIVLAKFRPEVLWHGYSTIWAGHRGINNTKDAISKYYYWPDTNKDITFTSSRVLLVRKLTP